MFASFMTGLIFLIGVLGLYLIYRSFRPSFGKKHKPPFNGGKKIIGLISGIIIAIFGFSFAHVAHQVSIQEHAEQTRIDKQNAKKESSESESKTSSERITSSKSSSKKSASSSSKKVASESESKAASISKANSKKAAAEQSSKKKAETKVSSSSIVDTMSKTKRASNNDIYGKLTNAKPNGLGTAKKTSDGIKITYGVSDDKIINRVKLQYRDGTIMPISDSDVLKAVKKYTPNDIKESGTTDDGEGTIYKSATTGKTYVVNTDSNDKGYTNEIDIDRGDVNGYN